MKNKRYMAHTIIPSPTEKFPDMVLVTKGKKISKRFVNEQKAKVWIETIKVDNLIESGSKSVKNELMAIGINPED